MLLVEGVKAPLVLLTLITAPKTLLVTPWCGGERDWAEPLERLDKGHDLHGFKCSYVGCNPVVPAAYLDALGLSVCS